jgi:hypothetical protein
MAMRSDVGKGSRNLPSMLSASGLPLALEDVHTARFGKNSLLWEIYVERRKSMTKTMRR